MADVEIEDRGTVLLPGAHRVVRTLDPTEGPFAGTLVTRGDGVAVRVDAASLAGWVGWRFAGAEHVASPVDVIRRADGHDALLPWCTDRVLGFLVRRTAADAALTSGECSTLVVSLLRGLDELGESADAVQTGVWWLTDGGRPTFVIGQGEDPRVGATEVIERLRDECGDKALTRVLTTIEDGIVKALTQPRVPHRSLEDWEKELLAIAAPRPLEREVHAPERAREVARTLVLDHRRPPSSRAARRDGRARSVPTRHPSSVVAVVRRLRSGLEPFGSHFSSRSGAVVARRGESVRPPARAGSRAGKRPLLLFAGAAAAAVLVGGLLWPSGDSAESANAARGGVPSADPSPAVSAPPDESDVGGVAQEEAAATPGAAAARDDPVAAASTLLTQIAECHVAEDLVCTDVVVTGSAGVVDALASAAGGTPTIELVDEYGDVAVVRLGSPVVDPGEDGAVGTAAPDQMLVLVRQDEKWLVRDVYGVADQPG
ncbi:hypothetical protein [Microbacterium sp. K24]|uniref:hypothetical protein n=1 Tax=Microbacterium sp. K24 TaxID=2305446 RepID=UPI001F1005BB|nr:hypothetical protein [Microbacterium sp. K24]